MKVAALNEKILKLKCGCGHHSLMDLDLYLHCEGQYLVECPACKVQKSFTSIRMQMDADDVPYLT